MNNAAGLVDNACVLKESARAKATINPVTRLQIRVGNRAALVVLQATDCARDATGTGGRDRRAVTLGAVQAFLAVLEFEDGIMHRAHGRLDAWRSSHARSRLNAATPTEQLLSLLGPVGHAVMDRFGEDVSTRDCSHLRSVPGTGPGNRVAEAEFMKTSDGALE